MTIIADMYAPYTHPFHLSHSSMSPGSLLAYHNSDPICYCAQLLTLVTFFVEVTIINLFFLSSMDRVMVRLRCSTFGQRMLFRLRSGVAGSDGGGSSGEFCAILDGSSKVVMRGDLLGISVKGSVLWHPSPCGVRAGHSVLKKLSRTNTDTDFDANWR